MKIFLDDVRNAPDETWTVVRNSAAFVNAWTFDKNKITHISFDHDLGDTDAKNGYDCVCMVEFSARFGQLTTLPVMTVHSDNGPGIKKIRSAIDAIERYAHENGIELR